MAEDTGCRRLRQSPVRRDWNLMVQEKTGKKGTVGGMDGRSPAA